MAFALPVIPCGVRLQEQRARSQRAMDLDRRVDNDLGYLVLAHPFRLFASLNPRVLALKSELRYGVTWEA